MERARASSAGDQAQTATGDIAEGRAALLARSHSAGGSVSSRPEQSGEGWERRVARLRRKAEERRARLYIVRRCLHMLLCWHDDTKR